MDKNWALMTKLAIIDTIKSECEDVVIGDIGQFGHEDAIQIVLIFFVYNVHHVVILV